MIFSCSTIANRVKIILCLFIVCLLITYNSIQAQSKGFSLELIGEFNMSAMNLDRASVPASGYGLFLLEKEKPAKPFWGFSSGVQFMVPIGERWQVGTGLFYEVKGRSSGKISSTQDPDVQFSHSFFISSYQIPLLARWYLSHNIWKCRQFVTARIAADVYGKFTAQEYRYSPMFGKEKGSYEMLYFSDRSHRDNFIDHLSENLIRLGFGGGYGLSFDEIRFLTLKAILEFRFYSDLLRNEIPFAIPGNGSLISFGFSIGLKSN